MGTEREQYIKGVLEANDLRLSERIGQHFLVDQGAIDLLVASTLPGAKVIEVGSGIGHVTEAFARRAGTVIGIEIDRRFQPALEEVQERNPNVQFILKDALYVPFGSLIDRGEEAQVVANIPFHITEPFLQRLIDLPISNAVLIVGDNIASELQAPEGSPDFGKMSLLAQTFFDVHELTTIPRDSFYPPPRTEASMIVLEPKGKKEIEANPAVYTFASLFRRAGKYGLVKNDVKQAIVEVEQNAGTMTLSKQERHQKIRSGVNRELREIMQEYSRGGRVIVASENSDEPHRNKVLSQSQAIQVMNRMGIPESVLEKPFSRLDNNEVQKLTLAVRNYYR
ncbi:MAG: methyltransferase domain-containing protein [Candidatus Levybacteria bacterium]|nr:methyltransferase domain-containing protein [Candidatus Levybacteria bacterium]